MPVSWHLGVVNLPRNRLEHLWKRQALHLVIFLLAGSLTERHKHSLKMKATKINSNQPCVKTLMQNMQADLLFIWQKAVIRRSRLGWDLRLLRCLFFRIPDKPRIIYSDWVIMQFLISCFCTVHFLDETFELLMQDQNTIESTSCTLLSLENILIALEGSSMIK